MTRLGWGSNLHAYSLRPRLDGRMTIVEIPLALLPEAPEPWWYSEYLRSEWEHKHLKHESTWQPRGRREHARWQRDEEQARYWDELARPQSELLAVWKDAQAEARND